MPLSIPSSQQSRRQKGGTGLGFAGLGPFGAQSGNVSQEQVSHKEMSSSAVCNAWLAVGLVVVGDRSSCNRQIVFADVDSTQQFMC